MRCTDITIMQMVKNMIVNCQVTDESVERNCGKNADKKMTVLGLLAEIKNASLNIFASDKRI